MSALALSLLMTMAPPAGEASASPGGGPIDAGDFRLGLNGGLFGFTALNSSEETAGVEVKSSTRSWGFGFSGVGADTGLGAVNLGWTLGYAITPAIEAGTHLNLGFGGGSQKISAGDMETESKFPNAFQLWLLPYFHYNLQITKPLNLVFEGSVGYLHSSVRDTESDPESTIRAHGPTFGPGVGVNFFVTRNASLDLLFSYHFGLLNTKSEAGDVSVESDVNMHQIMFRLGASIWMGGGK